jgi:hypothetical protein
MAVCPLFIVREQSIFKKIPVRILYVRCFTSAQAKTGCITEESGRYYHTHE